MTEVRAPTTDKPPDGEGERSQPRRGRLEEALDELTVAIDAARVLGLPTDAADVVRANAQRRLGFPADVYVLALVGGTGVGKSSLLNALAGTSVSEVTVRRPTTDTPVAWLPRDAHDDLGELLGWLEVDRVREYEAGADGAIPGVAILDLPDMDSVEAAHRQRVERLLPRVDAVVWVTDPEKYHDAVLHDEFLRAWLPRLDRQAVVLNKRDRLAESDVEKVRRELERDLAREARGRSVPVIAASALDGRGGVAAIREWLAGEVDAKRVVRDRLHAAARAAIGDLAAAAGLDPRASRPPEPFLGPQARRAAIRSATERVLQAIDLEGLDSQAVAATRARARARGTGPMGLVTSAVYRVSGREQAVADPDRYLARWREHGSLAPAIDALRDALAEPLRRASPAVRPTLAASVEAGSIRNVLETAVDRAVARQDRTPPRSLVWPLLGILQTVATGAIIVSLAWIVVWILARPPVDTVTLPVFGSVPVPFLALIASLAAGYVIARLLGLHAGWVGRRWARGLRAEISGTVERELTVRAFEGLDRLEEARARLVSAAATASSIGSAARRRLE